jgi:arsenite methyltransferase
MSTEREREKIRAAIQTKYAEISRSALGRFAYPTGIEGARALGYDVSVLSRLSPDLMKSFCGVGNPFLAGALNQGETLLDVGCGAGLDLIVAAQYINETGRLCGIDITPEMTKVARENAATAGVCHLEVREGTAESIPYEDRTFDVVISNGVLNQSPQKDLAFLEIFRVLGPAGRLLFSDIVLEGDQPRETPCTLEAWSD